MKMVSLLGVLVLAPALYTTTSVDAASITQPANSTAISAISIEKFTAGMNQQNGYFDIYYDAKTDKVYLHVDKFKQPFIFQSSLPRGIGSNDIGLDRGQLGATRLVQFEQYGNKVLLKQLNTYYRAETDNAAERLSIDEAFASSVIAGLPVVASTKSSLLVDYTDFLKSDIHQISASLARQKQGNYKVDSNRSGVYLPRTKAFVRNTELEALVTYSGENAGNYIRQVTPASNAISVHLHHSLVALPEDGYEAKPFHPYSGYWNVEYMDYGTAFDAPIIKRLLPKHRLAKKNPNAAVSEAVEPIIYYLDPGVPEPVRTALIDGAMWWNSAFEKIGYKDAFQVKDLPKDADPMDVRYNVIQWVHRATRGWSYGASVTDPRTGEIIKGHVTLGSLRVRQDYLIATGVTAPYSSDNADVSSQKAMALARIRQLSAHEIGHTIGLAHNFAGSANGLSTVMDYPHPKFSIKDGNISVENAYREGLGEWDNYTIAYGYGDYSEAELAKLAKQAKQQGLAYISDQDARPQGGVSALGHLWDNGSDPVAELNRLNQVRQVALANFGLNNIATGQPLASLQEALVPVYLLHRYQVEAVTKLVGGAFYEYEVKGDYSQPKGVKWVDSKQQLQALDAMLDTVQADYLTLPNTLLALIPPKAFGDSNNRESFSGRYGLAFDPLSAAEASANFTLKLILHPQRLNRLSGQQLLDKVIDKVIASTIEQKGAKGQQLLVQQRVAHVSFYQLMQSLTATELAPEAQALLHSKLHRLDRWLAKQKDASHQQLHHQWQRYLETNQWQPSFEPKPLPPGSPI
ncbi:zinc-dependent metalloprotease [Rheinheimera sp. MMS21-TC3]|uniref:zinc-dependent metalloprotease n=1 Tax=Rheinheimera sp. MMS21-TC3 TaxID=3072790 RepID=UPI0028C48D54|nr:zinc-dependent metalloprotease [Rheinheimera sp. MMS21-TC3]WNO61321.1 zinc-dependent metalloprotease [Rheinheimera sp. MMS21-TC3]